jgi:hypothetical protein
MSDFPQCQADDERLWTDLDEDPEVQTWTEWGVLRSGDSRVRLLFGSGEGAARRQVERNGGTVVHRKARLETVTRYSDWQESR